MEAKSTVIVVRLPKALLEAVDRLARAQYLTRSEAMRALLRERIGHKITPPWPSNDVRENQGEAA